MRRLAAAAALALVALAALAPPPALAHRLAPSLLELREVGGGRFDVRWKASLLVPLGASLEADLPRHCAPEGPADFEQQGVAGVLRWRVDCGERGLVGERVGVSGLSESGTDALLRIAFADGRRVERLLRGAAPSLVVPARARSLDVLREYVDLGVRHIASGPDHLLFVFGLVLLVTGGRLLATITAFTIGHSVTLALAALGFVAFPGGLVEVAIAGSIFALAVELARGDEAPSLLRRRPWLMVFAFGLLHGLGFAGALTRVGLPAEAIPLALLGFNLGIELGQVAFVALVLGARALLHRAARAPGLARGRHALGGQPAWRQVPIYAMGTLSAYWLFERIAAAL